MSTKYIFSGHKVLVTGGARGVGKCIVQKFAEAGCTEIYVIDKDQPVLDELKQEFPFIKVIQQDLLNWEETRKLVDGLGPLDHVINNAGIAEVQQVLEITSEEVDKIFGINFKAIVNVSQAAAKGMIQQGKGGTIVNISSVVDNRAIRGIPMYSCTKAAVTMLTKALAYELAPHKIRVNCVRPSIMMTNIINVDPNDPEKVKLFQDAFNQLIDRQVDKNVVTVEDTANSVLFLCSDASAMVNGSDILVDGGMYTN